MPCRSMRGSHMDGMTQRLLVVLCVVVVIVTSFSLFYWNRLFGWVVGSVLRALYWKSNNVWVEFGTLRMLKVRHRFMSVIVCVW